MLLSLVLPTFALTVPVRVAYHQDIVPGEAAIASHATTASLLSLSNPETGKSFVVSSDELTANRREASGRETFSFYDVPADSIRTWAVYYIDADGEVLGDPEVIDVSFDATGNGSVAARPSSSRLASLSVTPGTVRGGYQTGKVKVSVQDAGANAAYIGILELTNTGDQSDLATDPDMTVMDGAAFATFQLLDLNAIVALDAYTIQLEGDVSVTGLGVATDGTVEAGADLRWDLGFSNGEVACEEGYGCTVLLTDTLSYTSDIAKVKKKSNTPPRVALKDGDLLTLSSDASQSLIIEGKVLDLEVSAAMDVYNSTYAVDERGVVALDPFGFGVQAKAKDKDDDGDTGVIIDIFIDGDTDIVDDNQAPPPPWELVAANLFDIVVVDSGGVVVSSQTCQMSPTAATVAGTLRRDTLVGECTRDEGTEVRRVRASIGSAGYIKWTIELAGPTFAESVECVPGSREMCTAANVLDGRVLLQNMDGETLLSRKLDVTETAYDLPFVFDGDVDGLEVDLAVELYSSKPATWSVSEGLVTATVGTEVIASFDAEDIGLSPTADCTLKEWEIESATVPTTLSTGPVTLVRHRTGPGRFVCR